MLHRWIWADMTSCGWPSSPVKPMQTCLRASRTARGATPDVFCAARFARAPALLYVDGRNGVKDFDVWSFYAERDDGPFPYRWRGTTDYGASRFGRHPDDPPSYLGRRLDLLGHSLRVPLDADPAAAVRGYLTTAGTDSAKKLAAKAVVLIHPQTLVGKVVWPEVSR